MNAIAPIAMGFGEMERLAVSIAKSNMFGMKTPEQALVLMAIAQAEGRHPALAARDYDVIQGRPSKKAEAMLRDFLEGGGKVVWNALDDTVADATFSHPQGGSARISWDMQRAAQAGLGGKDNWKKFPRQMLRSRTVSEGVRTVWPMATSGLYVSEEAADMPAREPPHNGPTLEAKAEAPTARDRQADVYDARAAINRDVPMDAPKPERTPDELLASFRIAIRDCGTQAEVERLIAHKYTAALRRQLDAEQTAELEAIIAAGVHAHAPVEHDDSAWPGPDPQAMAREREAAV
jgi:hypothetical protein